MPTVLARGARFQRAVPHQLGDIGTLETCPTFTRLRSRPQFANLDWFSAVSGAPADYDGRIRDILTIWAGRILDYAPRVSDKKRH